MFPPYSRHLWSHPCKWSMSVLRVTGISSQVPRPTFVENGDGVSWCKLWCVGEGEGWYVFGLHFGACLLYSRRRCVLLMWWCGLLCIQFLPQSQLVVEVRVKSAWRWIVCMWRVYIATCTCKYSVYEHPTGMYEHNMKRGSQNQMDAILFSSSPGCTVPMVHFIDTQGTIHGSHLEGIWRCWLPGIHGLPVGRMWVWLPFVQIHLWESIRRQNQL